jgi:hypothetical protein
MDSDDPATAVMIATISASVLSAGVGAVGAISQGNAAANAADYNAQVSRNNAATAMRVAAAKEEAQRRQANQVEGEQTAAIAQAGIGFGGSAADIARQTRINEAMNALNIRYEGQTQSQNYMSQANLLSYQAGQDRTAGYLGAGSAILGGVADYGAMSGGFKKGFVIGP